MNMKTNETNSEHRTFSTQSGWISRPRICVVLRRWRRFRIGKMTEELSGFCRTMPLKQRKWKKMRFSNGVYACDYMYAHTHVGNKRHNTQCAVRTACSMKYKFIQFIAFIFENVLAIYWKSKWKSRYSLAWIHCHHFLRFELDYMQQRRNNWTDECDATTHFSALVACFVLFSAYYVPWLRYLLYHEFSMFRRRSGHIETTRNSLFGCWHGR